MWGHRIPVTNPWSVPLSSSQFRQSKLVAAHSFDLLKNEVKSDQDLNPPHVQHGRGQCVGVVHACPVRTEFRVFDPLFEPHVWDPANRHLVLGGPIRGDEAEAVLVSRAESDTCAMAQPSQAKQARAQADTCTMAQSF